MLDRLLRAAPSPRRDFLGRVGAAFGLTLAAGLPRTVVAEPVPEASAQGADWLSGLKGKHRQLFDMPEPADGFGLLHIRNYLNTWRDAFGMKDSEINAVGTFYGKATVMGFTDDMWAKYKFGAVLNITDATTKAPLDRNMFYRPQQGDNFAFGFFDASIEALQARGVLFILCNNALHFWAMRLSAAGMGSADDIAKDLLAHVLPKVVVVPGMVVAINQAQEAHISYMKL
jgi:intracellular sulfur oxidation DsrE/DsrF family protein